MIAWTLFFNPMELPSGSLLPMLLPLCLAVSIIYKTIRTNNLARLWISIVWLFCSIVVGLALLCTALVLILKYWP